MPDEEIENEKVEDKDILKVLNILKSNGDYGSMLKSYCYLRDSKQKDLYPQEKAHAFLFMRQYLDEIGNVLLNNKDNNTRRYAIEFLIEVGNEKSLRFLSESLLVEKEESLLDMITDGLLNSKRPYEINQILVDYIGYASGRRFECLIKIISDMEDPYLLKDALSKTKKRCPIGHERCVEDITLSNSFFVGHKFSKEKIDDLRPYINEAVKTAIGDDCKPYYADDEMREGLFCKICGKIQSTKFGIYDISVQCDTCHTSNPNVMVEIGMSFAFGKSIVLIVKKGSRVPSDLEWMERIEYGSYKELKEELIAKLPGKLGSVR